MSKSSHGLTSKQLHFCRLVAAGTMSNAEAYRQAYDANGSKKTSVEAASRLLADSKVGAMVESIYAKKETQIINSSLSSRSLVISKLTEAIDDNEFGVNRLKALSLFADVLGLKKSTQVTQVDDRSSETILSDLEAKLRALGLGEDTNTDTDMNYGSDLNDGDDIDISPDPGGSTRH
jgi:hypothetical protein